METINTIDLSNCTRKEEHEERLQIIKEKMPSEKNIENVCNMFKILGEPSRLKIVLSLLEGELCVQHITKACQGNQSAVSHQLRVLKDNRIIKSRREGQSIIYSIADTHILKIIELSKEHLYCHFEEENE